MGDSLLKKPVAKNEAGVLAGLWRNILKENHFIPAIDVLVNRYVNKQNRDSDKLGSVRLKAKSTLLSNISSSEMTFKTFLDLIFNFLGVKKIHISIKLTFSNGEESIHSIGVNNPNLNILTHDDKEGIVGSKKQHRTNSQDNRENSKTD